MAREKTKEYRVRGVHHLSVKVSHAPLTFEITRADGTAVQRLSIDEQTGYVTFSLGNGPVLGLGEGYDLAELDVPAAPETRSSFVPLERLVGPKS